MGISNQYVGIIFTAIAVDYFPRLAAVNSDSAKVGEMVNQQSEVMLLIVTPLLITMMVTVPLIISVLLTAEFLPITNFIRLAAIGVFFQAAKQSMDLISFAKGDTRTFVTLSVAGSSSLIICSIAGYAMRGLNGVGAMLILHGLVCFSLIYYIAHKKYNYIMSVHFRELLLVSLCPIILVCSLLILIPSVLGYAFSVLLLCASVTYSVYKLDKLIGLKESCSNFISRF